MKQVLLCLIMSFMFALCFAQQDAMFTHYMYNTIAVNPAYAGSRESFSFTLLHRTQWLDFPGAPQTQTFSCHSPIMGGRNNIGFSVIHDEVGPVNTYGATVDYAFKISFPKHRYLSFGMKLGAENFNISMDEADTYDYQGEIIDESSSVLPNVGFGLYYYSDLFYIGASSPRLVKNYYKYEDEGYFAQEERHYYLISGGLIKLDRETKFKPTTLVKMTQGAPVSIDLTTEFLFEDKFSLGAFFRIGDAVGILASVEVFPQLMLGYSFDWSYVNETVAYNNGSHEIILRYDIPKKKKQYQSKKGFCRF